MTEFKESEYAPGDDPVQDALEAFAKGNPWAFVVADISDFPSMDMQINTGGGIPDVDTLRALLKRALEVLPE